MSRDNGNDTWIPAELVAIDTRVSSGIYARLRTDHGTDLRIDPSRYRLDADVMTAIARLAEIDRVDDGTGAFVRIRLDEDGFVREIADIDGRKRLKVEPHYAGLHPDD